MDGPYLDHNQNRLHQGTARCVIGALPVSYEQEDAPPYETINGLIKSFIAPGLELHYEMDASYKAITNVPVTEDNAFYNKLLSIEMICDDRQENYWALDRYIQTIQSGKMNGFPILDKSHRIYGNDGQYRNRLMYIPRIDIIMGDDSYQKHQTIRFSRCFPADIGDLNMNFLDPDPVTFNVHFYYTGREIIREEPPRENTIPTGITQ